MPVCSTVMTTFPWACSFSKYQMISVHNQDQVVLLPVLGEIFHLLIDDMLCPKGAHHFQVPRTAYRFDFSPERFGDMHCKRSQSHASIELFV